VLADHERCQVQYRGVPRSQETRDRNRLGGLEPGSLRTEGESHDPNPEDIRSSIACFGFECLPRSEAPCLSPLWRRCRNTRSVNHKRWEELVCLCHRQSPWGRSDCVRCSDDLEHWNPCGHVFDAIPAWILPRSQGTKDLWAPDISYVHHEYRLYYAYSLFGKNTSGVALATNKTLDPTSPTFKWVDKGLVLESKTGDNFNAIDPNFVLDGKGRGWLAFGSFWGGIKMRRLSDAGLLSTKNSTIYSLARQAKPAEVAPALPGLPANWQAIEAPYIVRHNGYFYLFTSWDLCCRGLKSTYRTMVGGSKSIVGPYVDADGRKLADGGGTELLSANSRWLGPGYSLRLIGPAVGRTPIWSSRSSSPPFHGRS
jgi:arabinan endo-1,5-alpha-L-arabinosidase